MNCYFQNNRLLSIFLFFSVIVNQLNAQDWIYSYQHFTIEEGLNSNYIRCVFQDSKGFIWIGTNKGVNRYDGQEFISFLEKDYIVNIGEDELGNIWFDILEGDLNHRFKYLDPKFLRIYPYSEIFKKRFPNTEISRCFFKEKKIWFTTKDKKLYFFRNELIEKTSFAHLCTTDNCDIVDATDKSYIILDRSFLSEHSYHEGNVIHKINSDSKIINCFPALGDKICCIYKINESINRSILFSLDSCGFKKNRLQNKEKLNNGSRNSLNFNEWVLPNDRLAVWIKGDFFIKNKEDEVIFDLKTKSQRIYFIFKDIQNNFWISTNEGLIQLTIRKNIFQPFLQTQAGIYTTRGIYQKDDALFVCTAQGQMRIDLNSLEEQKITSRTADYGMIPSEDKKHVWIGVYYASLIVKMNIDTGEETVINETGSEDIHLFIHEDTLTNNLWISGHKGLYKLDTSTLKIIPVDIKGLEKPITMITDFYQQKDGLWLLGLNQIVKINPFTEEKIISYDANHFNTTNTQFSFLYIDSQDVFWLGTKGDGLLKWNPKTKTKKWFKKESGFLNLTLHAIYEDKYNRLWIPTDYGLVLFHKETETTQVFLPEDGLNHQEFNSASHFQAEDSTLFFGGLNGVVSINPNNFQLSDTTLSNLPLQITAVSAIEGKTKKVNNYLPDVLNEKTIQLSATAYNLKIHFALLDYSNNDKITYAYRSSDKSKWEYTSNSTIQYSAIPYGKQKIEIKAQNALGQWSEVILLSVDKAFALHQKWWFRLLCLVFTSIAIGVSFRLRTAYLRNQAIILEQKIAKQTVMLQSKNDELLSLNQTKDKFFALIAHDLRSPLISLKGIAEKMNFFIDRGRFEDVNRLNDAVENAISNVTTLLDNLLNWALVQKGDFPYEPQVIDLSLIIDQTIELYKELATKKQLDMKIQITKESYVYADRQAIFTVLRNLVDNAIKYTPSSGYISIQISKESQAIFIKIRNSVENISRQVVDSFFTLKKQGTPSTVRTKQGTGLGLVLCKELVELNKGNIAVEINKEKEIVFTIKLLMIDESDEIELTNSDMFYGS